MSSFREKAQVFVVGLSIGLLIAGAFFILKLDDYFKELHFFQKGNSTTIIQPVTPINNASSGDEEKSQKVKVKSQKATSIIAENTSVSSEEVLDADTLHRSNTKDSINNSFVANDDIVVRKDELLSTKTVEVFNLNPTANKMTCKDSLLEKVSGIKDDRSTSRQMFNIEFWQSPLNYKGYKMSKYKIIVYGIASAEGFKIYNLDDAIYLKYQSNTYKLDYSGDFKPYERITDENIINKLK